MLARACLTFAKAGHRVSVLARKKSRLERLTDQAQEFAGAIVGFPVDYCDSSALKATLAASVEQFGPVHTIVAWIHSTAPEAPQIAAEVLSASHPVSFFHVLGSASADPSREARLRPTFSSVPNILYHEVILGFVVSSQERSRWLTNEEISEGVLNAVAQRKETFVVGTVHPWSHRP